MAIGEACNTWIREWHLSRDCHFQNPRSLVTRGPAGKVVMSINNLKRRRMGSLSTSFDEAIGSDDTLSRSIQPERDRLIPAKTTAMSSHLPPCMHCHKYTPYCTLWVCFSRIVLPSRIDKSSLSRKRGRPRKYPVLPNNGRTFKCVPTAVFLAMPAGCSLPPSVSVFLAKFVYHRSYVIDE